MKYFNNKIFLFVLLLGTLAGCLESDDLMTENAKEGGALLSILGTEGKLLGVADPETEIVDFTDNDINFKVQLVLGQYNNETFTLVKQFKGQEVTVEEFSTLPFEYSASTLAEFLSGFNGVTANDLRIGDAIRYVVKINTKNGVFYSNDAQYNVVVNCGSDLAGNYTMNGLYTRADGSFTDDPVGPRNEVVSKVGVNTYGTLFTGHWTHAALGVPSCPLIFTVQCGIITIPEQYLCDYYGNRVSGTGYVDEETGDIYFEYQITGGALRTYTFTYTKN
jgi:hypothetical protein